MEKKVRKAVRCYFIRDNKILVTKYKCGIKKDYYEIPGGKIEEGETSIQAAIREVKEETGLEIKNLKLKGNMIIEYPNRIFDFDVFLVSGEFAGVLQETEENTVEWIEIEELLKKEKILSNIKLLDKKYIQGLIDENSNFKMKIQVEENEKIVNIEYVLEV